LLADQFVDVGVALNSGMYEVCGPQFDLRPGIRVNENALASRAEFVIGSEASPQVPDLQPGSACVHIENKSAVELLVRLEQATDRNDAITAADASRNPLFRKLFPKEVVKPESLVDLKNVYLLAIRHLGADDLIDQVGEIQVREYWSELKKHFPIDATGCEIVENSYDSMLVSFGFLDGLLETLNLIASLGPQEGIPIEECCFAINSGEIMIGSQTSQPVAFGKTVRNAMRMLSDGVPGSITLLSHVYNTIEQSPSAPAALLSSEFKRADVESSSDLVRLERLGQ
jgi:hypothetical protein